MPDVSRQTGRELTEVQIADIASVKAAGDAFMDEVSSSVAQPREKALARTKIEEAVMWAVKGITA